MMEITIEGKRITHIPGCKKINLPERLLITSMDGDVIEFDEYETRMLRDFLNGQVVD